MRVPSVASRAPASYKEVMMRFGHIGIKVLDVEKSIQFYETVLEAKIIKDFSQPPMWR